MWIRVWLTVPGCDKKYMSMFDSSFATKIACFTEENVAKNMDNIRDRWNEVNSKFLHVDKQTLIEKITPYCMHKWSFKEWMRCRFLKLSNSTLWLGVLGGNIACYCLARLRSFISSVILPSSLSYVPCTVLKFRVSWPGGNVSGIFHSRNFSHWVLTTLFHPLANI